MSVVLALNEFYHDTAAALVVDGRLVALIEQERLDRRKHAPGFALLGPAPRDAVRWCLDRAGLGFRDVDRIAVSFDADAVHAVGILAGIVRGNLQRASLGNTLRNRTRLDDPARGPAGGPGGPARAGGVEWRRVACPSTLVPSGRAGSYADTTLGV